MNLKYLPMRVELSFWHFTINLLSESRGIRSLVSWIFSDLVPHLADLIRAIYRKRTVGWVTSGLVLILLLGFGNYLPTQGFGVPSFVPIPLSTPATGQQNLLLVGVDDLASSSPSLKSIWLVGFFPGKSDFLLFPLYPNPIEDDDSQDQALVNTFSISPEGIPNQAFINILEKEIWWNYYLVIDEAGIAAALDFLSDITLDGRPLDLSGVFSPSTQLNDDQFDLVHDQTRRLQVACTLAASLYQEELIQGLSQIAPHIKSNLNLTLHPQDWSFEKGNPLSLRCEFPITDLFKP